MPDVLTLDGDRIVRVDGFLTAEMLRRLGQAKHRAGSPDCELAVRAIRARTMILSF